MVLPIFTLMKDILPLPPPKGRKSVRRAAGTMATHMPPHHRLMHHCVTIFWPFKDLCCVSARQQNAFKRVGAPHTWGEKCAPPSITDPLTLDTLFFSDFFWEFFFSTTMGARLRGQFSLVARFLFRASAVGRTWLKNTVHVLKPVVVPLPAPTKDFLPIQPPKGRKSAGCVACAGAKRVQPYRRFFHHLITLFLELTGFFCVSARHKNVFERV